MRLEKAETPLVRLSRTAKLLLESGEELVMENWIPAKRKDREGRWYLEVRRWDAWTDRRWLTRCGNEAHATRVLCEMIAHQRTGDGVVPVREMVDARLMS